MVHTGGQGLTKPATDSPGGYRITKLVCTSGRRAGMMEDHEHDFQPFVALIALSLAEIAAGRKTPVRLHCIVCGIDPPPAQIGEEKA